MSLAKLIVGPPGSGKTTTLLFFGKKEADVAQGKQKTICLGSILDSRGKDNSVITTHNDCLKVDDDTKNIEFLKLKRLGTLTEDDIRPYDIILIDEGHFFSDLVSFVDDCIWRWHKIVMVAGIASDVNCEALGNQMCHLLARATEPYSIVTLASRCAECLQSGLRGNLAQATYVKIIGEDDRDDQIKVGGFDIYRACCAYHHPKWRST